VAVTERGDERQDRKKRHGQRIIRGGEGAHHARRHTDAITAGADPVQLRTCPGPDEWSANDVLAHLRSCADVWGGCIASILVEDRPNIRAVNPTTWIKSTDYPDLEFRPSPRSFCDQRAALRAVLEVLPEERWSRAATVTGGGKVLERTVQFYAEWLARHERPHVGHIERAVNASRR